MTEDSSQQRPRRIRRRRVRSGTDSGQDPDRDSNRQSSETRTERPRGPRSRTETRDRSDSSPGQRSARPRSSDSRVDSRRNSRPGSREDRPSRGRRRRPGGTSDNGMRRPSDGDEGPRRRRRVDSRRSGGEGIRDTTASRMAAAEERPGRRSARSSGRAATMRSPRTERRNGLEILKLLQQQISIDPYERYQLETTPELLSTRVIDLITPIGRGQRAMIVSPPKAGKTTLLIQVAEAIHINHPEVKVFALLVDERPEEVTHFRRSTHATVYAASSDMSARDHVGVAEDCMNTIVEPVLQGEDVVLLLDSITRLARAYNTLQGNSGRTLSGGLDATTMLAPRQVFGAARKIEDGGSLTILGTALVDTGSRMDEVIFQEFKGTGNTELVLSRDLFEKRIFPSVDIGKSGTRKEEKLYPEEVVARLHKLRRLAASYPPDQAMIGLLKLMQRHKTNEEVLKGLAAMD